MLWLLTAHDADAEWETHIPLRMESCSSRTRLPSLAELRPDASLLEHAEALPMEHALIMQRLPGQMSHCKTLGDSLGGSGSRTQRAWSEFEAVPPAVYEAISHGIAEYEYGARSSATMIELIERCQLLLSPPGLVLLRTVTEELHSLDYWKCWAWCARPRGVPWPARRL